MISARDRFERLLLDVDDRSASSPRRAAAIYFIEADGPVRFEVVDETVSISTPVYVFGEPDREICWDAIAEFNATFLHDGGYRLSVDSDAALIVEQRLALDDLESFGLVAYLQDFVSRCATCTRWYRERVERARPPALEPTV